MRIHFGIKRHIKVHHVTDTHHINTTRCNVSSHQNINAATFQLGNGALTQLLTHITINRRCTVATGFEFIGNINRVGLGPHENNNAVEIFHFKHTRERIELIGTANRPIHLLNGGHRSGFSFNLNNLRIAQIRIGNFSNGRRHRGRKQSHLTLAGGML